MNNISNAEIHDIKIIGLKIITFILTSLFSLIKKPSNFLYKTHFQRIHIYPNSLLSKRKKIIWIFHKPNLHWSKKQHKFRWKIYIIGRFHKNFSFRRIGGMVMLGTASIMLFGLKTNCMLLKALSKEFKRIYIKIG